MNILSGDISDNPDIKNTVIAISKAMKLADRPVVVALDGRSGTGKSTIAQIIVQKLGGVAINADNFWAGGSNDEWDTKSPKEKAELAIDWKRMRVEVLELLLSGKPASWRPFDWKTGHGLSPDVLYSDPKPLIVLDGAYSTRPELQDLIELSILVEVPSDADRRDRLLKREGETYMNDWHGRWDVAEDYYFSNVRPRESFNLIIANH